MSSFAAPAPRATTGGPADPSGLTRLVALVFWIVLPVLGVTGIVLGVTTWTVHAHRQVPGIPGRFVVDNRSCGGSVCLATGTFTSTGGNLVIGPITGATGWSQNSSHDVVYDPSTPDLILPLPSQWNPTAAITSLAGAAVLLVVWGWLALGASGRGSAASGARRPHPSTTTGPALA